MSWFDSLAGTCWPWCWTVWEPCVISASTKLPPAFWRLVWVCVASNARVRAWTARKHSLDSVTIGALVCVGCRSLLVMKAIYSLVLALATHCYWNTQSAWRLPTPQMVSTIQWLVMSQWDAYCVVHVCQMDNTRCLLQIAATRLIRMMSRRRRNRGRTTSVTGWVY